MRIHDTAQDGFILSDYPRTVADAETLEELHGGINAFVHLSLPERFLAQLEEAKFQCEDCSTVYYGKEIEDREFGIVQEKTLPSDADNKFCLNCGSHKIDKSATNPEKFEADLKEYNDTKGELLDFYSHHGLLVDIDLKNGGIGDYETVRRKIQYNIKF